MANRGAGRTASAVGMMDGAFFVGRVELLAWVNNLLQLNLAKVEQCASGAVYCQIVDACHPGSVGMKKVNWMAKVDHEYIPNYKVLQVAFEKNGIERHIDVDKLIRAKYQDNLEFLQFMKCYWEREGSSRRDYDPLSAREGKPLPPWAARVGGAAGIAQDKENFTPKPTSASGKPGVGQEKRVGTAAAGRTQASVAKPAGGPKTPRSLDASGGLEAPSSKSRIGQELNAANLELQKRNAEQEEEITELQSTLGGLEKERDFYFNKLRLVEEFCTQRLQESEAPELKEALEEVQKIMYSPADEEDELEVGA